MSAPGDVIRTAAGKRAVAKSRPPSPRATSRPVERAGRTLSADTIEKLQLMIGHITAARDSGQAIIDESQAMIAANEAGEAAAEKLAELVKQWSHALR